MKRESEIETETGKKNKSYFNEPRGIGLQGVVLTFFAFTLNWNYGSMFSFLAFQDTVDFIITR